jgi:GTPase
VKFVDSCDVDVVAGKGGNGAVAFRREKFVPFGGPSGGDGGRGGDVVFVADEGLSTLVDLTYARTLRAPNGEQGHGKDMYGRGGEDQIVRVPLGTQVRDRDTGELLFDIDQPNARVIVAKGGKGGRGNIHFATPYDRAPRRSEPGEEGEEKRLRLELKVMADVGLLGFPNVGKSTFIRAVSRARPKVAAYEFTTLTPHLGVVRIGDEATMVIADIPGLVPGAADGVGLGHRFLKHVERTRALLHLVTLDFGEGRDPVKDYDALMLELERFDAELAKRPQIVAMTKADLPEVREAYELVRKRFAKRDIPVHLVSAATGEGVRDLTIALYRLVTGGEVEDWERPAPPPPPPPPPPSAPRKKVVKPKKKATAHPPRPTVKAKTKTKPPAKAKSKVKTKATKTKPKAATKKKKPTPKKK